MTMLPSALAGSVGAQSSASGELSRLCGDYWDHQMKMAPTWASYLGDRRFESDLGHCHAASRKEDLDAVRGFLDRLAKIDRSSLPETDRVTVEVLEHTLRLSLEAEPHRFYQWDVDQMSGPQVWLFEMANYHPVDDAGWANFLKRLRQFPGYVDEYVGNLREGLEAGNVAPEVAVVRVIDQLDKIAEKPEEGSPLLDVLKRRKGASGDRGELLGTIRESVRPAYEKMRRFLREEYRGRARTQVGIGWNEAGKKAYEYRIRHHTSLPFTAEELHRIGREELGEIRERMKAIARKRGDEGDLKSFNEKLRKDAGNFYPSREEVVSDAKTILDRVDDALPRLFGRLPKLGCEVKAIEEYRERDAPAAYYYGPPDDGSRPGIYYVNTCNPGSRARYNLTALTLHEAVPGHHLQIALAQEMRDLPQFRRHIGVTAYVEGWALYAELLGDEESLYLTDLDRYGMLTYQAWRAARLVVDTGMHAMGWTREQAVQFFRENVAISEAEILNEIDRYIIWPGQALAYMVGRREIQSLRRKAAERLGTKFDLRAFHDELLRHGAVPLPVLRNVMERWLGSR